MSNIEGTATVGTTAGSSTVRRRTERAKAREGAGADWARCGQGRRHSFTCWYSLKPLKSTSKTLRLSNR
jgi:hypothetical protein